MKLDQTVCDYCRHDLTESHLLISLETSPDVPSDLRVRLGADLIFVGERLDFCDRACLQEWIEKNRPEAKA